MAHEAHDEFPPLTREAQELLLRVEQALLPKADRKDEAWGSYERILTAAVIREAMRQVEPVEVSKRLWRPWLRLEAIADNLHCPLPPPTLEEMQQALQQLENWRQVEGAAIPAAGVSIGKRLRILRRGIAHHCQG